MRTELRVFEFGSGGFKDIVGSFGAGSELRGPNSGRVRAL